MKLVIYLIVSFIFLTGCTNPIPSGNKAKVAVPSNKKATIYVFNSDKKNEGQLSINNKIIGYLDRKSYTWFIVPSGKLKISIHDSLINSYQLSSNIFNVSEGKSYFVIYNTHKSFYTGDLVTPISEVISGEQDYIRPSHLRISSNKLGFNLINMHKLVGNSLTP